MTNWLISVINSKLNTAQETWNAQKEKKTINIGFLNLTTSLTMNMT